MRTIDAPLFVVTAEDSGLRWKMPKVPFVIVQSVASGRAIIDQLSSEGKHVFAYFHYDEGYWMESRTSRPGMFYHGTGKSVMKAACKAAEIGTNVYHVIQAHASINLEEFGVLASRIVYLPENARKIHLED